MSYNPHYYFFSCVLCLFAMLVCVSVFTRLVVSCCVFVYLMNLCVSFHEYSLSVAAVHETASWMNLSCVAAACKKNKKTNIVILIFWVSSCESRHFDLIS